jgi:hypothetical protein
MVSCVLKGLKHKYSGLNEIDYYWRVGQDNNISKNLASTERCESTVYLFSKILNTLKSRSDYKKRKKEFQKFITLHFANIIVSSDNKNTQNHIEFCERYYNNVFVGKSKIISKIALFFQNIVLRKLVLYFLIAVFFCNRYGVYMIFKTLNLK